ncbi:hypothetical protein FRC08_007317 [Ceratobasidium sp. 394]|nr:hypothetical protein FRC08_007317 [Ceratobasidium sp. 394]
MEDDKTDEALRREREKKADAKRQQNALPEWHLQSTVSGHLTTLGLKNEAQNAQYSLATADQAPVDRKPFAQGEVDLDAYYSSLNKQGDSASEASTPVNSQSSFLGKREREEVQLVEDDSRAAKVQKINGSNIEDEATNPIVYVAGEAKRFLDITEEEQERMTPEEYEAYAEVMIRLS